CGGWEDFSHDAAFTHSSRYLFVLDQPQPADSILAVLRGPDRLFSLVPPATGWSRGAEPSRALWSPTSETLYYRRSGSVWRWTARDGAGILLNGVSWVFPTITPDGRHLAYAVARADGKHDVYLADLQSGGAPVRIGLARTLPVFLNNSQLWYESESDDGCTGG